MQLSLMGTEGRELIMKVLPYTRSRDCANIPVRGGNACSNDNDCTENKY